MYKNSNNEYRFMIGAKNIFLFIVLLFLNYYGTAQRKYHFDYITTKDGLLDNYVQHINQDSYSNIWISTYSGICRYDGKNFYTYTYSSTDSTSIPNNYVIHSYEDKEQRVWVCTQSMQIAYYDRQRDCFKRITLTPDREFGVKGTWRIHQYNDSIYIITAFGGLCVFNFNTLKEEWYQSHNKQEHGMLGEELRCLVIDEKKDIWVGTEDKGGLQRFDFKTRKFEHFFDKNDSIFTYRSMALISDSVFILGSFYEGVYSFNKNTKIFSKLSFPGHVFENGFVGAYDIKKESDDVFWISSSSNDGVIRYNFRTKESMYFANNENSKNALNSSSISTILIDNQKNIWFGTHGGGINIVKARKSIFRFIEKGPLEFDLSHRLVSSIVEDENGNFWIGTDGGGLHYYNTKNHIVEKVLHDRKDFEKSITGLSLDEKRNILYVATWNGGLYSYNYVSGVLRSYKQFIKNYKQIANFNLKHVHYTNDTVIISTHFDGVNFFDVKTGIIITKSSNTNPALSNLFHRVYSNKSIKDSRGNFWICSTRGLYKFSKGTFKNYMNEIDETKRPSDNYVSDIFEDSKGRLWIGTSAGPNLYDYTNDCFIRIDEKYSIKYNIKSIVEDKQGTMWMGTSKGLLRIDGTTFEHKIFTESDGLQENQFFERAIFLSSGGDILIGSTNGLNIFNPLELTSNDYQPPVYLTDFRVFNQSQKPSFNKSLLKKHIHFTEEIQLKHDQNFISFDFSAIDFTAPEKIKYAYMLEGFDNDWVQVGNTNSANYTNLPHGTYAFNVKATNSDGIWSKTMASVKIHIITPWWKTWWFSTSLIILIVSSIVAIYLFRVSQIKRINNRLKREVARQTNVLNLKNIQLIDQTNELSNQFDEIRKQSELINLQNKELDQLVKNKDRLFSILGHDLKNPLNGIMGFSEMLVLKYDTYDKAKILKFLGFIQVSSHSMLELLDNILTWARSNTGQSSINPSAINLREIAENNVILYNHVCQKKGISLQVECSKLSVQAFADYNMIDTIVRNLVNNAVKFTNEGGQVIVYVFDDKQWSVVSVKDSGLGMSPEKINELLTSNSVISSLGTGNEKGTGLGFQICLEFAKINKGYILIESKINVGTEIFICVHKNQSSFETSYSEVPNLPELLENIERFDIYPIEKTSNLHEDIEQYRAKIENKSILIVEDDPTIRSQIVEFFTEFKVRVHEAPNGKIGFEKALSVKPDIIVSDIVMPIINGIELCEKLKQTNETKSIPVIILSAEKSSSIQMMALNAGAKKFITKPASQSILFKTILQVLEME